MATPPPSDYSSISMEDNIAPGASYAPPMLDTTPYPRRPESAYSYVASASPRLDYSLSHLVGTPGRVKLHWPPPEMDRGRTDYLVRFNPHEENQWGGNWTDYIQPSAPPTRPEVAVGGASVNRTPRRVPASPVLPSLRRRSSSAPANVGHGNSMAREKNASGSTEGLVSAESIKMSAPPVGELELLGDVHGLLKSHLDTQPGDGRFGSVPGRPGALSPKAATEIPLTDYPTIHTTPPSPTRSCEARSLAASGMSRTSNFLPIGGHRRPPVPRARSPWSLRVVPPSPAALPLGSTALKEGSKTPANNSLSQRLGRKLLSVTSSKSPDGSSKVILSSLLESRRPPRSLVKAKSAIDLKADKEPKAANTDRFRDKGATTTKESKPHTSAGSRSAARPAAQDRTGAPTTGTKPIPRLRAVENAHPAGGTATVSKKSRSRSRPAFSTARAPPSQPKPPRRAITPPSRQFKVVTTRNVTVFDRLSVPTAASRARAVSPNLAMKGARAKSRAAPKQPQRRERSPLPLTRFQIWEQRGYAAYEAARLIEMRCFMEVQKEDVRNIRKEINFVFVEMRERKRDEVVDEGYKHVAGLLKKIVWVMDGEDEEGTVLELVAKVEGLINTRK